MKCLSYHGRWLKEALAAPDWAGIPDEWHDHLRAHLPVRQMLGRHVAAGPAGFIDRFGVLPAALPAAVVTPIPDGLASFAKSFAQCAQERAQALVDSGRPLTIYWSGGIDSSVIMAALAAVGAPADQICVNLTWNSVMENPVFFRKLIRAYPHKLAVELNNDLTGDVDPASLVVTGDPGDMLFGSSATATFTPTQLFAPYAPALGADVGELIGPLLGKSPRPIATLLDAMSFLAVVGKWQYMSLKWRCTVDPARNARAANIVNFFETDDFQRWALVSDEPRLLPGDVRTHKWAAKLFLHAQVPDEVYLRTKIKIHSYQAMAVKNRLWRYMLEDGTVVWERPPNE